MIITMFPRVPALSKCYYYLYMPLWMGFGICSLVCECFMGGVILLRYRGNYCFSRGLCSFVRVQSNYWSLLDLLLVWENLCACEHISTHKPPCMTDDNELALSLHLTIQTTLMDTCTVDTWSLLTSYRFCVILCVNIVEFPMLFIYWRFQMVVGANHLLCSPCENLQFYIHVKAFLQLQRVENLSETATSVCSWVSVLIHMTEFTTVTSVQFIPKLSSIRPVVESSSAKS